MNENLDDELFPEATAERFGTRYTSEYGVTYICDHIDELGYCWVQLDRPASPGQPG